jgi:MFS family permease
MSRAPISAGPLRHRPFRWFFAAQTVNVLGTTMVSVALAFAVLEVDDSPTALGVVLAANSIPMIVFLLLGGVLADRVDRGLLLRGCNLAAFATSATFAALVLTGSAEVWSMALLGALNGTVAAASLPAMAGILPQLVPREDLQRANVLVSMSRGGLAVIGPSLSAGLVVTVGPGWALAVDAATWLAAALLLLAVRLPPREAEQTDGVLADLRVGWTFVRGTTWLWVVVLAFSLMNAVRNGGWSTLGPVRALETVGERGWGLALSATAAGLLAATLVMLRLELRRPLLVGMLGVSLGGVPLLVLGLGDGGTSTLVLLVVTAFVAGAGTELFNLGWNLSLQEHVPSEKLSRVYSYDMLGSFAAIPVGQLAFGPLGAAVGVGAVVVAAGVAYLALALLTLLSADVRRLERAAVR